MSCYTARQSAYGNVISALSIHFRLHVEGKKDVLYKHDIVFPETVTFFRSENRRIPISKIKSSTEMWFYEVGEKERNEKKKR